MSSSVGEKLGPCVVLGTLTCFTIHSSDFSMPALYLGTCTFHVCSHKGTLGIRLSNADLDSYRFFNVF